MVISKNPRKSLGRFVCASHFTYMIDADEVGDIPPAWFMGEYKNGALAPRRMSYDPSGDASQGNIIPPPIFFAISFFSEAPIVLYFFACVYTCRLNCFAKSPI